MEIQHQNHPQSIFKGIVQECDPRLQFTFLQFLSTQIILAIAVIARKYKKQAYFYDLAMVLAYFKSYFNRVDRSMYYFFYEEKQFRTLEQTFIINIAKKADNIFFCLRSSYQELLDNFQQEAHCVQDQPQLRNLMQCIFFQTDYPLPACKRQTIGVYCQTPYQQYMSLIRFPIIQTPDEFIDPPLTDMRKYFMQENDIHKVIQTIQGNYPENMSKMSLIRYCPYQMRNLGQGQLFIQNFQLHNLVVVLYKLIAVNARASYKVIMEHEDPIMRMAEFTTRANIFKNIILAIEEKFNFLFDSYGQIYSIMTKGQHCPNLPKFRFSNGAMTIWVQQCHQLQTTLCSSFNYILLRQRELNAISYLSEKSQHFPSLYNSVKLQLEKKSLFQARRNQTYKDLGVSYEKFFEDSVDSYDILARDFLEHQIDASVNEINVHRCGHSEQTIKRIPFFAKFINTLVQSSNDFYSHLQRLIFKKNSDKKMRLDILKGLIKCDLEFIDEKFTKPVILKEILISAQELIVSILQKQPEFSVFTEQAYQKFGISFDFSHKDNLLDYFCAKSQTQSDCAQNQRCFYDTEKDKTVDQIIHLASSIKQQSEVIQSQFQEQFYESSLSNCSVLSMQEA